QADGVQEALALHRAPEQLALDELPARHITQQRLRRARRERLSPALARFALALGQRLRHHGSHALPTFTTRYGTEARGSARRNFSPFFFPSSAFPSGEAMDSLPFFGSASSGPTST